MQLLQKESFSFQLKGCATDHIMYVRGGEPLSADVQSLSAIPQPESDESQSLCCVIVTKLLLLNIFLQVKFRYYLYLSEVY